MIAGQNRFADKHCRSMLRWMRPTASLSRSYDEAAGFWSFYAEMRWFFHGCTSHNYYVQSSDADVLLAFEQALYKDATHPQRTKLGFLIMRVMLFLGQFNYGKRGILDMTHTRLFTVSSLRHLLEQRGFRITKSRGMPVPFPVALGDTKVSRFLVTLNGMCLRIFPTLFSYQILVLAVPEPSLELLLQTAMDRIRHPRADAGDEFGATRSFVRPSCLNFFVVAES